MKSMTHEEKLFAVTNKICELLKDTCLDLMTLKVGCKVNLKTVISDGLPYVYEARIVDIYGGGQIADTGDYDDMYYTVISQYAGIEDGLTLDDIDDEDIIGSPIRLDEVLASLEKLRDDLDGYMIDSGGQFVYMDDCGDCHGMTKIDGDALVWRLGNSIKKQSQEVTDFLYIALNCE